MRPILPLAALALLAACADSDPPDQTPLEEGAGYNMVDPVRAPLAEETQPALGEWITAQQDEQPVLEFGPKGAPPLFSLACDAREGVLLNRHGTIASGDTEMMTLTIGDASRELATNPVQSPLPLLRAAIPPGDDLLTQLGEADDPIRVDVGDGPALILPPSAAIGEFIQGCAASPPAASANSAS